LFQARKALRALKGLVKIQALVRGYLVRKRAAATLHSMQALIRAQTAVRSQRARRSLSKESRFLPEVLARKSVVKPGFLYQQLRSFIYHQTMSYLFVSFCTCRNDLMKQGVNHTVKGYQHPMKHP